jgi:hypothetical protein
MPATYEIDKQRRLVITTVWEGLTLDDALSHQNKLMADPDFDSGFSQLMDLTHASGSDLQAGDIRKMAERTVFSTQSRRAIVVSNNLLYGFGRMYEILRETVGENGIRVFRDMDEAVDWLISDKAIPDPRIEPSGTNR